ncbi:MAG TPA: 3'-5' exonuclease [Arenibaculum sp.]|nr:3'-5' exonuclease [Arenibaculum sp.]
MKERDSYRTDRLLVVDLELTCWDRPQPPRGEHPDIIEIGIVEIDNEALEIMRRERFLVRPARSAIGEFCSGLTGITPEDVARFGRSFPEVRNRISKVWAPLHKTWAAWGTDRRAVEEAAVFHGVESPFSDSYLDLGHLYDLLTGAPQRVGLRAAMKTLGLAVEGERHRAVDDAGDAARIYIELCRRHR